MIVRFLSLFQLLPESVWIDLGLDFSMLVAAVPVPGGDSRGVLLAIIAMVAVMWWRNAKKTAGALILMVTGMVLLSFMPEPWFPFLLLLFFIGCSTRQLRLQGKEIARTHFTLHLFGRLDCRWMDGKVWITEDEERALNATALLAKNGKNSRGLQV